jgi:hypothetical protein
VARILEKIIFGESAVEAIRTVSKLAGLTAEEKLYLEGLDDQSTLPFSVAVVNAGLNGQLPGSYIVIYLENL